MTKIKKVLPLLIFFSIFLSKASFVKASFYLSCKIKAEILKILTFEEIGKLINKNQNLKIDPQHIGIKIKILILETDKRSHGECPFKINQQIDVIASMERGENLPKLKPGDIINLEWSLYNGSNQFGVINEEYWKLNSR